MKFSIEKLRKIPLFKDIPKEKFDKIEKIIEIAEYPAGDVVIQEGDRGNELYILLDGEVEVSKSLVLKFEGLRTQREKSLVRLSSENYPLFGELCIFEKDGLRTATVTAVTRSKFIVIKREKFFKLAEKDKEIGYILVKNIAQILAQRLKKANTDILKLTTALSLIIEK